MRLRFSLVLIFFFMGNFHPVNSKNSVSAYAKLVPITIRITRNPIRPYFCARPCDAFMLVRIKYERSYIKRNYSYIEFA